MTYVLNPVLNTTASMHKNDIRTEFRPKYHHTHIMWWPRIRCVLNPILNLTRHYPCTAKKKEVQSIVKNDIGDSN